MQDSTPVTTDLTAFLNGTERQDNGGLGGSHSASETLFEAEGSSWSSSDEAAVDQAAMASLPISYLQDSDGEDANSSESYGSEEKDLADIVEDPLGLLDDQPASEFKEEVIDELRLTSVTFDPISVFTHLHKNTGYSHLVSTFERLGAQSKVNVESPLQDNNFGAFTQTKEVVGNLHNQMEELDLGYGGKLTTVLSVKASQLSGRIGSALEELLAQTQRIRDQQKLLRLVKRFQSIFSLPQTIRSLIEQGQYGVAAREFTRAKQQLTGSSLRSFQLVLSEIEMVRKTWIHHMRQTLASPFVGPSDALTLALQYAGDDAFIYFCTAQCDLLQASIARCQNFADLCAILASPLRPLSDFLGDAEESREKFGQVCASWAAAVQESLDLRADDVKPDPVETETALLALKELTKESSGMVSAVLNELVDVAEKLLLRGKCVSAFIELSTLYQLEDWYIARPTFKITSLPDRFLRVLQSLGEDGSHQISLECAYRFADSMHRVALEIGAEENGKQLASNRQLLPFQLLPLCPQERSLYSDLPVIKLSDDSVDRRLLLSLSNSIYTRQHILTKKKLVDADPVFRALETLIRDRYMCRNARNLHDIVKYGIMGDQPSDNGGEPSDWTYTSLHYLVFVHAQIESYVPALLGSLLDPLCAGLFDSIAQIVQFKGNELLPPARQQLALNISFLSATLAKHAMSASHQAANLQTLLTGSAEKRSFNVVKHSMMFMCFS